MLSAEQVEYQYSYGPDLLPEAGSAEQGMWRYRRRLPLADGPIFFPLTVGQTPLTRPPQLRAKLGIVGLWLKDETRGQSASNKDRATASEVDPGACRADLIRAGCAIG